MCFTVAVFRNNVLHTAEEYYQNLPSVWDKKGDLTEFQDYFFVSGFEYPALPILRHDRIQMANWGLVPAWIHDKSAAVEIRSKTLNARGETVFDKPSFRKSVLSQRAVLTVKGFYEWREYHSQKYPYFIQSADTESLNLGVIYDHWENQLDGSVETTFSIITTHANPLMEMIHNTKKRMPLILDNKDVEAWMDPYYAYPSVQQLIKPFDERKMDAYTISRNANSPRNYRNTMEILSPVNYPELSWDSQSLF